MKVILIEDIEKLGKMGDIVTVKEGYARNFLVPQGKVRPATPQNMKFMEALKQKRQLEEKKKQDEAAALGERLQKVSLTVSVNAGEEDKLFGSVTAEMVSELLKEEGFDIDKKDIILEEPIKKLGVYQVTVKINPDVKTSVKLWVVKK